MQLSPTEDHYGGREKKPKAYWIVSVYCKKKISEGEPYHERVCDEFDDG